VTEKWFERPRPRARFQSGLNDFEYCASLHILHVDLDPATVSKTLNLLPRTSHRAGDPRKTPSGRPLEGVYPTGHWGAELELVEGEDLEHFLWRLLEALRPAKNFLARIHNDNGEVECFIGIFATKLCDQIIHAELLNELGQFGISLRLDYYHNSLTSESQEEER
jgi:hypothetical protein